ncbi:MAG: DNA repair protein RadA [Saprospiraceae bacterium]|nr:DNA repair protein RadA [Saprospiraceae bacterium]
MVKAKTVYFCTECGTESAKWTGQCTACKSWNTLKEEVIRKHQNVIDSNVLDFQSSIPKPIDEIQVGKTTRVSVTDKELTRVLGGGIVSGSVILVGGQPGIGKSTLLLQIALSMDLDILYVSGEESEEQIKMRAERVPGNNPRCLIYTETDIEKILKQARKLSSKLLVIDSIQTLATGMIDASTGSISQIKECTALLRKYAKASGTPIFIIGHITKDGSIAGPKLLEHMVDVVLQFEGDQHHEYRILRGLKNRYGSTDEIGLYRMDQEGMKEVNNPSELLISQSDESLSGSAIAASVEGQRPLLLETQALVTPSVYGNPQRTATGLDMRRLSMLLAVLEKRMRLPFGQHDVFLNIVGGLKIHDPGVDLAMVAALISSIEDAPIHRKYSFAGEVGLNGEVRSISRIEQRVQEAARLGFEKIYIPTQSGYNNQNTDIEVVQIARVENLFDELF